MIKIKCVKLECQCKKQGLAQLFLNKQGEIKYARVRHYTHTDKVSKKPQFTYYRLDLEELKTLLKSQSISLSIGKADGSLGQNQSGKIHDLDIKDSSPVQQNVGGRRLVWFRTLAFQANDPGFESRRPHQNLPQSKKMDHFENNLFQHVKSSIGWILKHGKCNIRLNIFAKV